MRPNESAPALLPKDFYAQSALVVARELLGARLVRILPDGSRVTGRIVETEAYSGRDDQASHAFRRRTPRNAPMWGVPGRSYVYLTYGMHWLLNVVAEPPDQPAAVLLRALEPLEGLERLRANWPKLKATEWASGPGRLARALSITGAHNQIDLTGPQHGLWIEAGGRVADAAVRTGPRVGLGQTPEPWLSMPWRWWVGGNPHVSAGAGRRG